MEADLRAFRDALTRENHTLRCALTDPRLFSGIGNADSDEMLHRARLANLRVQESHIDLGRVVCIERQSLDTTTAGDEDQAVPQPGTGFFYLVQFYDGVEDSSYGSESADRARVIAPGNGDCP